MSDTANTNDIGHDKELVVEVVSAYLSHNSLQMDQIDKLIQTVANALKNIDGTAAPASKAEEVIKLTPAQVRKSIQHEGLISFVDGKSYKTLKRHLGTHGMTIADYKAKYGLPHDYPSTAPSYSAQRSEMAKSLGLGRKVGGNQIAETAPPKATRSKKAAPAAA